MEEETDETSLGIEQLKVLFMSPVFVCLTFYKLKTAGLQTEDSRVTKLNPNTLVHYFAVTVEGLLL